MSLRSVNCESVAFLSKQSVHHQWRGCSSANCCSANAIKNDRMRHSEVPVVNQLEHRRHSTALSIFYLNCANPG